MGKTIRSNCPIKCISDQAKVQELIFRSLEKTSPTDVLRCYRSMEPHVINSYLLLSVAVLLMMAVFVTLLNLAQPPLRRLIKHYFPGEQDYEIMA